TMSASVNHTTSQKVKTSAARKVGTKTKRPERAASSPVTITAAADVPGFGVGTQMDGMEQVTKALMNRVKGFSPFNLRAAEAAHSASGGMPVLNKVGVASFGVEIESDLVANGQNDYKAIKTAFARRAGSGDTLTAAGWCAPSENIYSFIADYV